MESIKKGFYLVILAVLMSVCTFQNFSVARDLRGYLGNDKDVNGICRNNYKIDFNPHANDYYFDIGNVSCFEFALTSTLAMLPGAIATDFTCANAKNAAKNIEKLNKLKQFRQSSWKSSKSTALSSLGYLLIDPIVFSYIEAGIQGASCPMAIARIGPAAATGCCAAAGVTAATIIGIPYIYLTLPYYAAQDSFDNVRVCGYDWYSYQEVPEVGGVTKDYPEFGIYPGSYSYKIKDCLVNSNCVVGLTSGGDDLNKNLNEWDIGNKIFREFIYQGKEFVNDECEDPRSDDLKGFSGKYQRYYLKGLEFGNYACYRRFGEHLSSQYSTICGRNVSEPICKERMEKAYGCCVKKSRQSICLERIDKDNHAFCYENDKSCFLSGNKEVPFSGEKVEYTIYSHPSKSNMICARTDNLCPYNHNVAGGMEEKLEYDYDVETGKGVDENIVIVDSSADPKIPTSSYGKAKNYCQLYAHCTNVARENIPRIPTLASRFFSSACQNLRGDSQNYLYREKEERIRLGESDADIWNRFIDSRDTETIGFAVKLKTQVESQGLNVRNNDDIPAIMSLAITIGGNEFASDLSQFISREVTDEVYDDQRVTVDEFLGFRGISAPIVQCVKETIENMFFNLDGYTQCIPGSEMNQYGNCKCLSGKEANAEGLCEEASGTYDPYVYKKGRQSKEGFSPLTVIQDKLKNVVRLILIFSLIFVGFKVLIGGVDVEKFDLKKIGLYLTKFGLIWYFALGTAWQQVFAPAVLNASQEISSMLTEAYYPLIGVCPAQTTRDIDRNCICDDGRIWNNSNSSCECPEYSIWNSTLGSCQPTIANMVWDFTNNRFVCTSGMGLDATTNQCLCLGNTVLQNGVCSCAGNASFIDSENGICGCNAGYGWDSTSASCVVGGLDPSIPLSTNTFVNISPNSKVAPSISDNFTVDLDSPLYDGCYFDPDTYPAGKGYLATFDAFDCKIARYMGYGPQVSVPGILVLMIPGLFTARLGVLFVLLSLSFVILIMLVTVRVVTTFLLSIFAIIILIYVSPLIIPLLLFKKTKNIFDAWLANLIGFILQPILLFAYIAVFLNVTEPILLGSAYFTGNVKGGRELVCQERINIPHDAEFFEKEIYDVRAIANPKVDSLLCLFGDHSASAFGAMAQSSGATGIGIVTSVIKDASGSGEGFFMRLITIFKGVLLMYLFFTLIDQIPGIASFISGSSALEPSTPGFKNTMKKTFGIMGLGRMFGRDAIAGAAGRAKRGFVGTAELGEKIRKNFPRFSTSLGLKDAEKKAEEEKGAEENVARRDEGGAGGGDALG